MQFVILFILKLFIYRVLSEHTEYYPSQSTLNSFDGSEYKSFAKRKVKANQLIDHQKHNEFEWRNFNKIAKSPKVSNLRAGDEVFRGHPKTREELWNVHFLNESTAFDQTPSLIQLIHNITLTYLTDCTPVILYDSQIKESYFFRNLLRGFPVTFVHGFINDNNHLAEPRLLRPVQECIHFIVFLTEVKRVSKVLGKQSDSKVVVVAKSSQWAVQEFLAGSQSRMYVNLLVIGQSFKDEDDVALVSRNCLK